MAPKVGTWLSLVEHSVRDAGVAGSNPVVPTTSNPGVLCLFVPFPVQWKNDPSFSCFIFSNIIQLLQYLFTTMQIDFDNHIFHDQNHGRPLS